MFTLFVLLTAWAVIVFGIGADSLWQNEIISYQRATQPTLTAAYEMLLEGNHAPLYELVVLRPWFNAGHSEFWHRVPSALCALLTIAVGQRLALPMFGRRTANVALVLLAFNPVLVYYAREGRMYALLTLLLICTLYFLHRSLTTAGELPPLIGYSLCATASLYTHYYAGLTLLAVSIFVLAHLLVFKRYALLVRWLCANVIVGLLFAPWLPTFAAQLANDPVSHIQTPSVGEMLKLPARFLTGYYPLPSLLVWPLALGVFGLLTLAVWWALRRFAPASAAVRSSLLLAAVFIGTLGIAFVFSVLVTPIVGLRYFTGIVPALLILVAFFVAQLSERFSVGHLLLVGLMGANLFFSYYVVTTTWRKAYRPLVGHIEQAEQAEPAGSGNDVIVLYLPGGGFWLDEFEHYYRGDLEVIYRLDQPYTADSLAEAVDGLPDSAAVWVIQANHAGAVRPVDADSPIYTKVDEIYYPNRFFFTPQAVQLTRLERK